MLENVYMVSEAQGFGNLSYLFSSLNDNLHFGHFYIKIGLACVSVFIFFSGLYKVNHAVRKF